MRYNMLHGYFAIGGKNFIRLLFLDIRWKLHKKQQQAIKKRRTEGFAVSAHSGLSVRSALRAWRTGSYFGSSYESFIRSSYIDADFYFTAPA